jgi:hypothetical protein
MNASRDVFCDRFNEGGSEIDGTAYSSVFSFQKETKYAYDFMKKGGTR